MTMTANVTQGTMFLAGPADSALRVVHVWGTSYDANYPVFNGHPRMPGLVYVDKHVQVALTAMRQVADRHTPLQPSQDDCMSGVLQGMHGAIDAPSVIHQLLASTQSGDMHTAVYDFAANTMYVRTLPSLDHSHPLTLQQGT